MQLIGFIKWLLNKDLFMKNDTKKTSQKLRFCGDFKKLKSMGFKFNKYYANNYIGYNFKLKKYSSDLLLIWKAEKDIFIENIDKESHKVALFNELLKFKTVDEVINSFEPYVSKFHSNDKYNPICVQIHDNKLTFINLSKHFKIKSIKEKLELIDILEEEKPTLSKSVDIEDNKDMLDSNLKMLNVLKERPDYEILKNSFSCILDNKTISLMLELIDDDMLHII